jgi:hypothetical protein
MNKVAFGEAAREVAEEYQGAGGDVRGGVRVCGFPWWRFFTSKVDMKHTVQMCQTRQYTQPLLGAGVLSFIVFHLFQQVHGFH